jgi:large subunit ribosomal protein L21
MTTATDKAVKAEKEPVKKASSAAKKNPNAPFAVFAAGGKQYRVQAGDSVKIEKIIGDHKEGEKLVFDKVLLVDDASGATIGTPFIKGVSINATLTKIGRHKKVTTIKYKQKSRYFKKYGHKQPFFEVKIESIK